MSLVVIKLGGDVVGRPGLDKPTSELLAISHDVAAVASQGTRLVLVHGGGPQATALQKALGQEPNVVAGRRITDGPALEVMKMAVAGQVNVDLCAALVASGARPVGLHGVSGQVIRATKRPPRVVGGGGSEPIDFGLVGDVVSINTELLALLCSRGFIPVIACLGCSDQGQPLNINADIVANKVAKALEADHLVLVTGTPGVLRDINDGQSRIERLTASEARAAIADGTIAGGMIPKIEESLVILEQGGVGAVHIVGKLETGDLRRALDAPGAVGTTLTL